MKTKSYLSLILMSVMLCLLSITLTACGNKNKNPKYNPKFYTVTFYNDDEVFDSQTLLEGSLFVLPAQIPAKEADMAGSYTFSKWVDEQGSDVVIQPVKANKNFYAQYDVDYAEYSLTFPKEVLVKKDGQDLTSPATLCYNDEFTVEYNTIYTNCGDISVEGASMVGQNRYKVEGDVVITITNMATLDKLTFTYSDSEKGYHVKALSKTIQGDVVIPSEYDEKPVIKILSYAFDGCTKITAITIPSSVTTISNNALQGCENLSKIVINKENTHYTSRNQAGEECNAIINIKDKRLEFGCKSTVIPNDDSVNKIGQYAFKEHKNLETIFIPKNITLIDEGAFSTCTKLKSVTFEKTNSRLTTIGRYCFEYTYALSTIDLSLPYLTEIQERTFENSGLKEIEIPDNITKIGKYALAMTDLTKIVFGENVNSIGDGAIYNCNLLNTIVINNLYVYNLCDGDFLEQIGKNEKVDVLKTVVDSATNSYLGDTANFSKTTARLDGKDYYLFENLKSKY